MNSIRYIITRSCLQEGSMRLLKYNEGHFQQAGPIQFLDERGIEYTVQVDRALMRVMQLQAFYHDHNLGVNDVLMITTLAPGRYQVEAIVKPHAAPQVRSVAASGGAYTNPNPRPVVETKRVVINSTPHVREVRTQTVPVPVLVNAQVETPVPEPVEAPTPAPQRPLFERPALDRSALDRSVVGRASTQRPAAAPSPIVVVRPPLIPTAEPVLPAPAPTGLEAQVAELAELTGYRLEALGRALLRLHADLGPQYSYTVLLALEPLGMQATAWEADQDDYQVLLTQEQERPYGLARLTREALLALLEQARLTTLTPMELRGYWQAGNLDLESVASIIELVSAYLAQRGAFTSVLLALAQQPAHSVISVGRLADTLGSSVNSAELGVILDTLTRPPFLALSPMPGGQYLLRCPISELLADLTEYAQSVRYRVRVAQPQGLVPVQTTASAPLVAAQP